MKHHRKDIIDNPAKLPALIYFRDLVLTTLCWIMYMLFLQDFFWFMRDVVTWVVHGFAETDRYESFRIVGTIVIFIQIIIIVDVIYIGWSFYNMLRFGKKSRRRSSPPVTVEQIAERFKQSPDDIALWQQSKTLVIHMDKRGHLTQVMAS
ncbi:MAG: poly-beta-1,6-N-acetyl-D-glucosamine biosynthesis protein PgaD [Alphaproteobacteria bacterium]|nr:poly-beta-1,6-N-acetyl-D-glucosamine biosynthesis protein PgaD [Alphaproteobacteria bacterium]MBV8549254.1 poly-beta-1,6-N-acetyl-D-glucosamine biosynthesis protein PgaD [Alphaproteobacteria bacterium]